MKTAIIIWVCALISGVGCVKYVDTSLNNAIAADNLQPAVVELQPAENTVQLTSTAPLQAAPEEPELQPALGYKALDWNVNNLTVQN